MEARGIVIVKCLESSLSSKHFWRISGGWSLHLSDSFCFELPLVALKELVDTRFDDRF